MSVGMSASGAWSRDGRKYSLVSVAGGEAAATGELELAFGGTDYSRDLVPGKDGNLRLDNDFIEVSVTAKTDRKRGVLCQTIKVRAKKKGALSGRYVATLSCPAGKGQVFVPAFWSYCGDAEQFQRLDTYYPHFTWMEGYKEQVRTPAVCAWHGGRNVTLALTGPHPTHFIIEKCRGGLRFVVCLDRPTIGPDGYDANPVLSPGEELTAQIYWDICEGDWQNGMKRWMSYNMANVVKGDDVPPAWTKGVRMMWCKWDRIAKRDIDEIAAQGVELLEVHPFTEPEPEVIAYAHRKGLKILLEHMFLCYYEPVQLDHLVLASGSDDVRIDKANQEMADRHPDWCALDENGKRHQAGYVYMCTNVEAFRKAKVKEAVDAVKRGYDGIRYDNALVLNCHSKAHKHTMTYAQAASRMIREIKQAVRKVNPDAVVCANNAGPDLYSLLDMHMYESGLSSESFLYEEAGKKKLEGSSYTGAHNRMAVAQVLWEFAGKRYCIHDYPIHTKKGAPAFWRSSIFTIMHNGICSFGGGIQYLEGSRLPEYRIAGAVLATIKAPLTDIINERNIAYRIYAPGTILLLETGGRKWSGTIKGLDLPLNPEREYSLYSLPGKNVLCAAKGKEFQKGVKLDVEADGYEVLQFRGAEK